jgi:hypothetical protein
MGRAQDGCYSRTTGPTRDFASCAERFIHKPHEDLKHESNLRHDDRRVRTRRRLQQPIVASAAPARHQQLVDDRADPHASAAAGDSGTVGFVHDATARHAAGRHGAEEINEFSERTDLAMRRIVNMALVAGAGFVLSWLVQSLAAERREVRGRRHKSEHKAAVSDWENEGGGLAPAHEPKH